MKANLLAAIFLIGGTIFNSWVSFGALPTRPELKQVFLELLVLAPTEAEKYLMSTGFKKVPSAKLKSVLFAGRLDQDSVHIFLVKKRLISPFNAYEIEIIRQNLNWYQVKSGIYELEFEIKDWLKKAPVTRITQPPRECLGNELNCIQNKNMQYKISWLWFDLNEENRNLELYLNKSANIVIYLKARR